MSAELDALSLKVQRILTDDDMPGVRLGKNNEFLVQNDSALTIVRPVQQEQGRLLVYVWSPLVTDVPVTPELKEWVLERSDDYVFGHLTWSVAEDGTANIGFSHTLLGEFLDPDELKAALFAVAVTANELDDEIKDKFGGLRWIDPYPGH